MSFIYKIIAKSIEYLIADLEWYKTLLQKEKSKKLKVTRIKNE